MHKLPVDTSTFSRIRTLNYIYVDKTEYMYQMITKGHRYFLSRPRRFGKSLLISTLQEILTGNKALFDGLWIAQSDYQWKKFGVINLDFSKLEATDIATFENSLKYALIKVARSYAITLNESSTSTTTILLDSLIENLFQQFGQVAILIDEYDSPILKTLHKQELAQSIRGIIQQFFTTIKGSDTQVQFVFITGVSSFVKAGIFSGINNLQILTMNKQFASLCGYTDQEIDHYFSSYITKWAQEDNLVYDELRQQIKNWYNGYHFGKNIIAVYNPFSVMNALHIQELKNFWFQSGTPTFLVELLKKNYLAFDPEKLTATEDFLGIFDVNNIPPLSLMFQAGYLTISRYDAETQLYTLDYPNQEVKVSFQKYLLEVFAHIDPFVSDPMFAELRVAFIYEKIDSAIDLMKQLFAHVPYQLHMKEEKFYHALLMMVCLGANIKTQSEYSTSHGRIDLILEFPKILYIIEVKFNKPAEEALTQIEERNYHQQFLNKKKQLILLGLSFKRKPSSFDISYALKKY